MGQAVVYTLTVAKDHTFFVGTARVLVHNASRFGCINARHFFTRIRNGKPDSVNTIFDQTVSNSEVATDVSEIKTGGARKLGNNRYLTGSGRVYVDEENGNLFPESGPGLIKYYSCTYAASASLARRHL